MNNYLKKTLRLVWHNGKLWIGISILINVFMGLAPLAVIWVSKELVDVVTLYISQGDLKYDNIIILVIIQFMVLITQNSLPNIQNIIDTRYEQHFEYILGYKISKKASNVPLAYFENSYFYDHLERIQYNKGQRLLTPIKGFLQIVRNLITLSSLLMYLISIDWVLSVITLSITLPIFYINVKYGKEQFSLLKFQTPEAREATYLSALLTQRKSAAEIRLFQLKNFFINRWEKLFLKNNKEFLSLIKKMERANIFIHFLSALTYSGVIFYLLRIIRVKSITVGQFVSVLQTISTTESTLKSVAKNLASIYQESLYIKDLFDFLDFKDSEFIVDSGKYKMEETIESIEFENVSFKYPYSNRVALKKLNLKINSGERVAIVGGNGSGKTTLVKCLMGLYPVTNGCIKINGKNVNEIKEEDIFNKMTVIFQDFMKYNFSIKENIVLNKETNNYADFENIVDLTGVNKIAEKFKDKHNTILGKVFKEGEDLSGGEWQKVSLSRALYKEGDVFILDEPTAALDPKAELELYNHFDKITKGKTSIFITHRMPSAKLADKILVMDDGEIIEEGYHKDLINNKGEYYRMYNMQSKWYVS